MSLNESAEMYLETIYLLSKDKKHVRSIDVAEALGYSRPSISRAVGLLKKDGFLVTDDAGFLVLTDTGWEIARKIYRRHTVLTAALKALGVDERIAAEDACRMEHVISEEALAAIAGHMAKCGNCSV